MYQVPPYFINGQHRITIILVGCGGSGSLILTKLARLHRALTFLEHPGLFVIAVDDDIVEEHNVGRQMFTNADIGDYKSRALISKINMSFGYDWESDTRRYNKDAHNGNIIISAVDNVESRREIHKGFYCTSTYGRDTTKKHLLIDCGNARDYGQVVLSDFKENLRNVFDIFGNDLEEQDTVEQQGEGCNYFDRLNEQDLFINDWVSLYTITILKDLIFQKQLNYQGFIFDSVAHITRKISIV